MGKTGERQWTTGGGMGSAFDAARDGLPVRTWLILVVGIVWAGFGISDDNLFVTIFGGVIVLLALCWMAGSLRSAFAVRHLERKVAAEEAAEEHND